MRRRGRHVSTALGSTARGYCTSAGRPGARCAKKWKAPAKASTRRPAILREFPDVSPVVAFFHGRESPNVDDHARHWRRHTPYLVTKIIWHAPDPHPLFHIGFRNHQ